MKTLFAPKTIFALSLMLALLVGWNPSDLRAETNTGTNRNSDGSVTLLATQNLKGKGPVFTVSVRKSKTSAAIASLDIKREQEDRASLVDIDKDGFFDVEISGQCGAGPNCEGNVYRFDPKKKQFYHFFSGGYSGLSVDFGYLIETGRASCCSWESHVYKIPENHDLLEYDKMEFGVLYTFPDKDIPASCKFFRPGEDGEEVINPPDKRWLTYCAAEKDVPEENVAIEGPTKK